MLDSKKKINCVLEAGDTYDFDEYSRLIECKMIVSRIYIRQSNARLP